jgi:hypothetical protein
MADLAPQTAEKRICFFVVERWQGGVIAKLYWDELPRNPIRNLEYVLRLDDQPNGAALVCAPLHQLYATYLTLKKRGTLPPRWQPPPPKKPPPSPSSPQDAG